MSATDWEKLIAGPLVEKWRKQAECADGAHICSEAGKDVCADELLAHLRESGICELLALVGIQYSAEDSMSDLRERLMVSFDKVVPEVELRVQIVNCIMTALAAALHPSGQGAPSKEKKPQ